MKPLSSQLRTTKSKCLQNYRLIQNQWIQRLVDALLRWAPAIGTINSHKWFEFIAGIEILASQS